MRGRQRPIRPQSDTSRCRQPSRKPRKASCVLPQMDCSYNWVFAQLTFATRQLAGAIPTTANGTSNGAKPKKRKKSQIDQVVEADSAFNDPVVGMSTSPETSKASTKKHKPDAVRPETSRSAAKQKPKSKQPKPPSEAHQKAPTKDPSLEPVQPVKGKCLRCREIGIKCNEAKPTCNQCLRGLWTCQYEAPSPKSRSKSGCLNCKTRKRKCTEERPSCAYCLKVDDDCMYGEYA
jgi:hypothetical protein